MTKRQKIMLIRILVAAALLVALQFLPVTGWLRFLCYMAPYLVVGYDILRKALKGILNRQVFDECFLMAVATVGAIALALYEGSGDYTEAIAVMLFYQVGEWFQSYAVGKSRRNISDLMDIRPDYANLEQEGKLLQVDPEEVEVGSTILVQPGEKVPIDGIVLTGSSTLNTAALTGESLPREVAAGDEVISGCINMTGLLRIRTTKEFGESTVSKILDLVENASSRKSKSEDFISKFARVYTPAVCFAALALAFLPPLARMAVLGLAPAWGTWVYRALTFLVISCPCALVISIPLSFFAGIGGASKAGVLVKGSNYLETLSQTKVVVFDKTGTLTQGVFQVNGIHHNELEDQKLLEYAALAESASSHPISKSIQRAYGKELDRSRVTDIQELGGSGVIATVDGRQIAAGNHKLMARLGVQAIPCHSVGTIIHMAIDGKYAGHIVISDLVKPHAKDAIQALKAAGVRRTVMLTGDAKPVADQVAAALGLDEVYSELLPAGKVEQVERLLAQKPEREKLAFVGDGINDAPVLSRADIGIAMGAMGSDAAIEAADVVLMDDDPLKIPKAIKISRKCLGIVYQNIVFAIGVKLICLALGALGFASMWLAIFADVGVMVLAVLNAIRALFVQNL
ncbi:MAG TPA: cadmium-translocating P-type ATPase [Candidatus Anaerotruncus excrementipullorum]|uniref:Cd(2+)-exporting ATPase n=1 Tax=Candidatus Anaerotruncus excrementipullorum TaxID=2838465 RepID=A0A9D1WRV2_9FIRM|nr:cadmium-translocating P-type ATPase [Candidatus Anaerotruncus excrementipullorum]